MVFDPSGELEDLTIPSAFIRRDDRVTSDDQFTNCIDRWRMARNINIAIARRCRAPIFNITDQSDGYGTASGPTPLTLYYGRPLTQDRSYTLPLWSMLIPITPYAKTLGFACRAYTSIDGGDAYLYPVVDAVGQRRPILESESITITAGAALVQHSTTCVIPDLAQQQGIGYFSLYGFTSSIGDDILKAIIGRLAITDVTASTVTVTTGATPPAIGMALVVYTAAPALRPECGIPQVLYTESLGGASLRVYLDRQWPTRPVPGSDTIDMRYLQGIVITTANAWCDGVSDFATPVAY